ncbi:MAG: hypothetical protein H5U40_10520, partial [Polyangiaceae bacterium]|nr:hypothetical protein [Polyangiaceae bacterium]
MSSRPNHRFDSSRVFFTLTLLGLTAAACDCSNDVVRPCDSANPPAACGAPCSSDGMCTGGTYCGDDGTCTADCVLGDGNCGSGQTCRPTDGRCVPSGSGGGGAGGSDGGDECQNLSVVAEPVEPYIVFVLDRSGSMTAEYPPDASTNCGAAGVNCDSRWDAMRNVLVGDGNGPLPPGVIEQFQGVANIAVVQYTGLGDTHDGTPTTGDFHAIWPLLIETPAAINNLSAIAADFRPQGSGNPPGSGDTPTGESLWVTLCHLGPVVDTNADGVPDDRIGCDSYTDETLVPMSLRPALETAPTLLPAPASRDLAAPIILVLATDGEPDSSVNPDPSSNSADGRTARRMTIDAVEEARLAGIPTYVVSVTLSTELNKHLEHVACQGGTGPTPADAPYTSLDEPVCTTPAPASGPGLIEAYNSDALRAAMVDDIIGPSIPCDFQLQSRVAANTVAAARAQGMVTIDGAPVSLASGGAGDGWWLEDDGLTFRLLGTACDTFRANPGS